MFEPSFPHPQESLSHHIRSPPTRFPVYLYPAPPYQMPVAHTHMFVTLVQDRKGFNVAGLDSNHSHFILVEDESYRKGAGFGCDLSTVRSTRVMVMAVSVACKRHRRCAALMMLDHARFNARASPAAI